MNEIAEVRPFLVMDKADEEQVLAEMRGEIIKEYVYSYIQGKKIVEGLSLAGINAVAIHMAENGYPLRVINQWITEDDKYIKAIVKVGRFSVTDEGTEVILDSTLGAKRQARNYPRGAENPFAYELAITKAERNARKKLMPEKIIIEMMKEYKKQGKTKKLEEPTLEEAQEYTQEYTNKAREEENEIERVPEEKSTTSHDPLDEATTPQIRIMKRFKIPVPKGCTKAQANILIKDNMAKSKKKPTRGDRESPLIPPPEDG